MPEPQRHWDDVTQGDELQALKKQPTPQQLVMWAGAQPDFNPIHYDPGAAQAQGLPDRIVHGTLKFAFLGQVVHEWMGYEGRIKRLECSYRGTDPVNGEITIKGVVSRKYEDSGEHLVDLDLWTENGQGQKTTPGTAVVRLPKRLG